MARKPTNNTASSASLGFEAKLWLAAYTLRTHATLCGTLLPKLLSGKLQAII
jgi:hypothetical protein